VFAARGGQHVRHALVRRQLCERLLPLHRHFRGRKFVYAEAWRRSEVREASWPKRPSTRFGWRPERTDSPDLYFSIQTLIFRTTSMKSLLGGNSTRPLHHMVGRVLIAVIFCFRAEARSPAMRCGRREYMQ